MSGESTMPIVSIIVPVYNAEDYLGFCITSVLNQTFHDFELILVNDGSLDGSLAICDNYAALDKRIKVIDIHNGGVSNARNTGLQVASGEFIQFLDSDDYIEQEMTATLVEAMENYQADLVVCGITNIQYQDDNDPIISNLNSAKFGKECVYDHDRFMKLFPDILLHACVLENVNNKLFRRELIVNNMIQFPKTLSYGEDFVLNLEYYAVSSKIVILPKQFLNYRIVNSDSLSQMYRENMLEIELHLCEKVDNFLCNHEQYAEAEGIEYLDEYCVAHIIRGMQMLFHPKCNLTINEKKRAIYKAISSPIVQKAFEHVKFIDPAYKELRENVLNYDIVSILEVLASLEAARVAQITPVASFLPDAPHTNPGFVNRLLTFFLRKLQGRLTTHTKMSIRVEKLRLYIEMFGLKNTSKKIILVILRK
jgi:glycosyltransferase involved in cell wall biosynthesis